jgi:hypothetical protein
VIGAGALKGGLSLKAAEGALKKKYFGIPGYVLAGVAILAGVVFFPKITAGLSGASSTGSSSGSGTGQLPGDTGQAAAAAGAAPGSPASAAQDSGTPLSGQYTDVTAPPGGYVPPPPNGPGIIGDGPGLFGPAPSTRGLLASDPVADRYYAARVSQNVAAAAPGGSLSAIPSNYVAPPPSAAPAPPPPPTSPSYTASQARSLLATGGPNPSAGSRSADLWEDHHPYHRRVLAYPQFVRAIGGPANHNREIHRIAKQVGLHPARLFQLNPKPGPLIRIA